MRADYFIKLFFVACVSVSYASDKEIPEEFVGEISRIQLDGAELYSAFSSRDANAAPSTTEVELMSTIKKNLCDGPYVPLTIIREKAQLESVYFILSPPKEKGIQFGRHFRLDFKLGTNEMADSSAISSKGCLLTPNSDNKSGAKSVGAMITHLLAKTPTEFHVFLNLYHQEDIFVATSIGTWKISNGEVSFL